MDEVIIKKAAAGLEWDAEYKKLFEEEGYISGKLLAAESYLDTDFAVFFDNPKFAGNTVLDIGTGTGEQAIYLAKKGFKVTATDVSVLAINYAKQQADQQNATVNFIQDNIFLTKLTGQFDFVIDRGCYALIPKGTNADYLAIIEKLLKPNGWFLLKTDHIRKGKIKILKETVGLSVKTSKYTSYKSLNEVNVGAVFFAVQLAAC